MTKWSEEEKMSMSKIFNGATKNIVSKENIKIAFVHKMEDFSKIVNENEFVLDQFNEATADAFGQENRDQGHDGVRDHVLNVNAIAVCYDARSILGFASIKQFSERSVFYVHGIATRASLQGTGIGDMMIRGLLSECKNLDFISLTTQSPVAYHLIRRFCKDIFPSMDYKQVPNDLQEMAVSLMGHRNGKFNPERFISRKLYSNCLYGQGIPMSKDKMINCWFEDSLNIQRGASNDGFLFIGKLNR